MEHGDGSTSKSQRSLEMYPSPCSKLHDNIGNSQLKEKEKIDTSSAKHLELFNASSIQLARRLLEEVSLPKDVWKTVREEV
jgi:hypothetical protein